jgi:hypothetical protein
MQHVSIRTTLDKGPWSNVQWNQAFLLVKSFKLVSRSLDKGPGRRQIKLWFSLHAIIHSFWKENQLIWTKKTQLNGERAHGLENQSVSWGSSLFISSKKNWFFFYCFLLLLLLKSCENGRCIYELRTLSKAHKLGIIVLFLSIPRHKPIP